MEEKIKGMSEDWLSLWLGLIIFFVSISTFGGVDLLGWSVNTNVWLDISKAISPVSENYTGVKGEIVKIDGEKVTVKKADGKESTISVTDAKGLKVGDALEKKGISGIGSLVLTYLLLLGLMGVAAIALKARLGKFIIGFTVVFWISYLCWLSGHYAYIAATPDKLSGLGIPWSLNLTGEAGYIIALLAGLIVGNFFPRTAESLKEATRPELYIKTAIVVMGAALGVKAAESLGLASAVMFRGLCAIVEAYLIYWALVYFIARKYFKFSREWAAPLASGISICGVSAAIATGGAIRARPIVPIMVSSLVVIFAVVELLILPYMAKIYLWKEPLVAGAWMGLAVKTDGAAVASGAITDSWVRAQALAEAGINYKDGWMLMTATTVKMFIDIFIGVWAFILAIIWCAKIECKPGEKVRAVEIWHRFPKFVLGYAATFFILLILCWPASNASNAITKEMDTLKQKTAELEARQSSQPDAPQASLVGAEIEKTRSKIAELSDQLKPHKSIMANAKLASSESNGIRALFFVLTFFTIGVVSNFKKLWEEGIGRLAAVYVISLFGFIIWIGLLISWIFFHGVKPPLAG
jgi:uncharacterized membrane protein YadS